MKKKTGLIITIIIIAVILVAAGALALLYFMTDLFKSNEQLFWKYVANSSNLEQVVTSENEKNQEQWKKDHSYTSKGDLNIAVTKETGTQEITIGTTSKHNVSNGRTYSDATLYNGEQEVLKASYINNEDIYALYCKDIYEPYYIGIRNNNLKEFMTKMGVPEEELKDIPDSIPLESAEIATKLTEEEEKYLTDTYSSILLENISKEKYTKTEKTNITINSKSYSTNGYELTLNQEEIKQIITAILNKAKEDEQTITILNNLLSNSQEINIKEMLGQVVENLQKSNLEEMTITFTVYPAGKQTTKLVVKYNNQVKITLDIDTNAENKQYANITIEALENEQDITMQISTEKQNLANMVVYNTHVINNSNYEITMETSLGSVIDNKIENNSRITIFDGDTTIESSYFKTTQIANQEVEVEELSNSSAVIINNYPKDQLESFFEGLGQNASNMLPEKLGQLNIRVTDPNDIIYYVEGIVSSFITIANANGVDQTVGTMGTTMMATVRQIMLLMTENVQDSMSQGGPQNLPLPGGEQVPVNNELNQETANNLTSQNEIINEQIKNEEAMAQNILNQIENITN